MSRNDRSSLTASSDLARLIPMLVPRPPFSFTTTARSRAVGRPLGIRRELLGVRQRLHRLDLGLREQPALAALEAGQLAREGLDRDLGEALTPHLLRGRPHAGDPMRLKRPPK